MRFTTLQIARRLSTSVLATLALAGVLASCAPADPMGVTVANVSAAVRRQRATAIRDACRARGLTGGALLVAALAQEETQLSFCASEFPACSGPASPVCGGRAVLSGGGDGPCNLHQGGLGMFQIDDGTEAQTVAAHGEAVLTLEGNTDVAIDRILDKLIRSTYTHGVTNRQAAIDFLNRTRIDDGADYTAYVNTVVRYWNGCPMSGSCWANRFPKYDGAPRELLAEFGYAFWYGDSDAGMPTDASRTPDAGRDAGGGRDSGHHDSGPRDSGHHDSGPPGCRSATLGTTVPDGDCVQVGPDRAECSMSGCAWYACNAGAWSCSSADSCTGATHANDACTTGGSSCNSTTLGQDVADGACVQVSYAGCGQSTCAWYRCSNGAWSCSDTSSCSDQRFGHPDCMDCGQAAQSCDTRTDCCPAFECTPRTFGGSDNRCCLAPNLTCTSDSECCGTMRCVNEVCECHNTGGECAADIDCCSGLWCTNGVCGNE